ncbi:MAG: hypothetical protein NTV54_15180 [Ignavibacteriales bacterium]|nr:hypothetical protein [Ignavibacteriales bacterium]
MEINPIQLPHASTYGAQAASSSVRPRQWEQFDAPRVATPAAREDAPEADVLTSGERSYFEQLFPTAVDAVRSYHAYKRDGAPQSVALGTVIDRKG